ncbi:MAG TPA: methyltransferase domain-containing protein [Gryllotalpicola sp.]
MSDEHLEAVVERFNARAGGYDDNVMHRELAAAVADFADLGGVETVLDVATGTGLVLRALAARARADSGSGSEAVGRALRLIGVDVSPGMLAVARGELPSAEFIEGRAEALPVADASADLVTCVTALHILADPGAFFDEAARVLAPEGALVTASFARVPEHGHGHGHGGAEEPVFHPNHAPFRTPEALAEVAGPAGFVLTRWELVSFAEDECLLAELAPVD